MTIINKFCSKSKLIFTFLILSYSSTFGQTKYKNKVINLNNDGVIGAVVAVTKANQNLLNHTITDNNGCFEIEIPANEAIDSLQLLISHLAYKTKKCTLNSALSDSKITLELDAKQIDDILITGRKPLYTLKNGKTVVNVSEVKFLPSDKSTDILSKLPFIDIVSEESIMYENKTAVVIIDGVEQKLEGKALIARLKSIPADQIDKVVLSSNPLGKYNSSKSVLEIHTKSSLENGYYANLDLTGERYSVNKYGASNMFSILGRYNKIQTNFSLQHRPNSRVHSEYLDSTIYTPTTIISRNTEWEKTQDTYQVNLGLAYSFDNGNVLSFTTNTYNDSGETDQDMKVDEYGLEISSYRQNSYYKHSNHLYTGLVQFSSNDTLPFHYTAVLDLVTGGEKKDGKSKKKEFEKNFQSYFQSQSTMEGTQYTGRFDMTYKVNKAFELNSGVKYVNGEIVETNRYDNKVAPSSKFKGKEVTTAFYANGQAKLNSKIFLGVGIRTELLDYNFNTTSGEEILGNRYWTWFPNLKMTYNGSGFSSILSVEKKVERPDYYNILPGANYIDDYSYKVGNTQLQPSTYWAVNSKSTILGFINVWLLYQNYKNVIKDVVYQKDGTSVFSMDNIGDLTLLAGRLDVPFTLSNNKLGGYLVAAITHQKYASLKNDLVWDENRNGKYYSQFKGEFWWDITDRFNVSSQIIYFPKKKELQYDLSQNRFRFNLAAEYALLRNKQLNLNCSVMDLTNSFGENKVYYYDNTRQHKISNNLTLPKFSLGINWKFNRGSDIKKKRFSGEEANDSRFSKKI